MPAISGFGCATGAFGVPLSDFGAPTPAAGTAKSTPSLPSDRLRVWSACSDVRQRGGLFFSRRWSLNSLGASPQRSQQAIPAEQEALERLRNAENGLQQAMQGMAQRGQMAGMSLPMLRQAGRFPMPEFMPQPNVDEQQAQIAESNPFIPASLLCDRYYSTACDCLRLQRMYPGIRVL